MKSESEAADGRTDIAIVGGGMVGATLALLLAAQRRQWRISLIEAAAFAAPDQPHYQPSFDARATALAAGSVELLAELQLWPALARHAGPIRQVHVSDRGHPGGSLIDAAEYGLDALGYVVPNSWLGSVLLQRLRQQPNIRCIAPAKVDALSVTAAGAELTVSSADKREILQAQVAVIADGAHSPLRAAIGIDAEVSDYRQSAIIANVATEQAHRGIAYERFTARGPLALLPLGQGGDGHCSALVWTHATARAEAVAALDDDEFLRQLQAAFGFRLGRFTRVGRRQAYPLQLIVAGEQVRSAVAVMGNAAHFLHPVAGQGFNLALRDCAALAETLALAARRGQRLGELAVLQQYQRLQALDQQLTVGFSDTVTRLFSNASLPAVLLRNLGFLALDALPLAKTWFGRQTMGSAGRRPRLRGNG